jgi:hypothetical protein
MNTLKNVLKITLAIFIFSNFALAQTTQQPVRQEGGLTQAQQYGACSGYHLFWATLSKTSGSHKDFNFSMDIADSLDRRFSSSKEYQAAQSKTITILTNAMKQKNGDVIRSFAGLCTEVNLPIGQNTK